MVDSASMAFRVEDLIVQMDLDSNFEHSFVTWSVPLRGDAVAAESATAAIALGLVGTPRPSAHPAVTNAPALRHTMTANFIRHSFVVAARFLAAANARRIDALENVAYRRSRKGCPQWVNEKSASLLSSRCYARRLL